jgi:hypothetical protein
MSRIPAIASRRITLAAAVVVLVGAMLFLVPAAPAAAFICQNFPIYDTLYFNNASHSQLVGECTESCTAPEKCTGTKTAYFDVIEAGCCD